MGWLSCTIWLCALPTCTRVLRAPLGHLDRDPTSVAPPQPADVHPPSPTALRLQWVMYLEKEDAKYSHWTAEECSSRWAGGTGPAAGRAAVHAVPCWQAAWCRGRQRASPSRCARTVPAQALLGQLS